MASESSLSPLIGTQVDGGHSDGLVAARDLKYHQQPPAYEGHQPTVKLPRRQQQLLIFKNISFIGAIIACIAATSFLPSELRTRSQINEGSFFLHATKKGPVNQKCFTSGFFAITLQFGDFSFDTAKLIDITWDLVVGRGGQLCLAYISYRLSANALLRVIELHPVSYELYVSISFNPVEARSICALLKSLYALPGIRLRLILVWMILALSYIISFGTIAGAMTGYVPSPDLFIKTGGDEIVSFENFQPRIIFDKGSAIGLKDGVSLTADGIFHDANGTVVYKQIPTRNGSHTLWDAVAGQDCDFSACPYRSDFKSYTGAWWTYGDKTANSSNANGDTASNDQPETTDPFPTCQSTGGHMVAAGTRCLLHYNNFTIDGSSLLSPDTTVCLTPNNAYTFQWGFSYSLLTTLLVLQNVWVFGMYILWLDTHDTTALVQRGRTVGLHRAAIDLADAIRDDFGPDLSSYSELQLQEKIRRLPEDTLLEYRLVDGIEGECTDIRLTSRKVGKKLKGDPPHLAWRSKTSGTDYREDRLTSPYRPYFARAPSSKDV